LLGCGSRSQVEADVAVGVVADLVSRVVGAVVVEPAEEDAVLDVGLTVVSHPFLLVVGLGLAPVSRTGTS
jgi:hypothetical protein